MPEAPSDIDYTVDVGRHETMFRANTPKGEEFLGGADLTMSNEEAHTFIQDARAAGLTVKSFSSSFHAIEVRRQSSFVLCLRHSAVFITKGLPPPGPLLIHTLFDCRYPSIASAPFSRPSPEAL